jgi:hypothetical protein
MKTIAVSTAFFAVAVSGGAFADIAGLVQDAAKFYSLDGDDLQVTTFEDADYAVIDLYVDFSAPNTSGNLNSESYLLNMFGGNVAVSGFESFVQFDASAEGSWKPQFSLDLPSVGAFPQIDSFVTINSGVGADAVNNTTLDPGFGDGLNDDIFNTDIGWYQVPPGDGRVMADLKVWVGRFVVTGEEARNGAEFSMSATVGYDYQNGEPPFFGEVTSDFTFIPTPGVLAAMGLGTLCLRRRQR